MKPSIASACLAFFFLIGGCASHTGRDAGHDTLEKEPTQNPYVINKTKYYPIPDAQGFREKGLASWYGKDFHGRPTSNGETYDMYALTAAHKTLPMNTRLRVRNLDNDREITVRVNDRGPFVDDRIIDLSYKAARKLKMIGPGTARVQITALPVPGTKTLVAEHSATPITHQPRTSVSQQEKPASTGKLAADTILPSRQAPMSDAPPTRPSSPQPTIEVSQATQPATGTDTTPPEVAREAHRQETLSPTELPAPQQPQRQQLYYVQVGKYDKLEEALQLKKRFVDAGHAAIIDHNSSDGQSSYLVHIFAGRKLAAAREAESELLARGYSGASVIVR